jgi:predicted outer membrane repeat protein
MSVREHYPSCIKPHLSFDFELVQPTSFTMKKILLFVAAAFLLQFANAQIYVAQTATGANNGTSWADAYTDLQVAIHLSSSGDTIWVAVGNYKPSIDTLGVLLNDAARRSFWLKNGVVLYGGFLGTETSLSQRDPVSNKATLNGEITTGVFAEHVLYVYSNVDTTAVMDGFIIENGYSSNTSTEKNGSGILLRGDAYFSNLLIRNNTTFNQGGAIYGLFSESRFVACNFTNNTTINYDGGAVNFVNCNIKMYNCVFFDNNATRFGGAIGTIDTDLLVQNATFAGNTAGTNIFQFSTSGTISLNNCIFTDDNIAPIVLGTSGGVANFRECLMPQSNSWLILCPTCWAGTATFVNPGAGDFQLMAGSEGIDDTLAVAPVNNYLDIIGNPRLVGYSMDLGAYEFQGAVSVEMPISNLDLTVYPNPTSEVLKVQTTETIESATIFNMTGQKVHSQNGNLISVAHLPAGMYLIQIQTAEGMGSTRFIKE